MSMVLLDVGADDILDIYLNGRDFTLFLFATNVVPAQSGVTYVEASGGGYAAKTLTGGNWVIDPLLDPSRAEYPAQTFTFSGALDTNPNIYGYGIKRGTTVIWAELLPVMFTPPNNGDPLVIIPTFSLSSGTPA
jgi:hypothetical protein